MSKSPLDGRKIRGSEPMTRSVKAATAIRIRDVDMAEEMVALTKNQILQQAGTAMLAQANQAPQAVLQLLR